MMPVGCRKCNPQRIPIATKMLDAPRSVKYCYWMTYNIELPQEEDRLLRLRAVETGKSPVELILAAVHHDTHRALRFDQRRREIAENFRRLGVSDDALADELEEIKHKMRAERRRQDS